MGPATPYEESPDIKQYIEDSSAGKDRYIGDPSQYESS